MPKQILRQWSEQRVAWLLAHGIEPHASDRASDLARVPEALRAEFRAISAARWHDSLDAGHGRCPLGDPRAAAIVSDALLHFDQTLYHISDFVIMPNHVHLLASFPDQASMLRQCASWKHYTATRINRLLGLVGHFWQRDAFDHLVRHQDQFDHLRRHIALNPTRAGLRRDSYLHYSSPIQPD